MPLFHGLCAFPITPADASGRVDADGLAALLDRLVAAGVDSIGLLGSTGTYAYLTRTERRRAVAAAVRAAAGRVKLIVGTGALRTSDAIDIARDAREEGADGLLLAPVSYTPLTEDEVVTHFTAVAAATDLPLCIYNNPSTTHFDFSDDLIARLADVPGIAAVKNPAPAAGDIASRCAGLKARLPARFAVGYRGDWHASEFIRAGADAWYSVVAGLLPIQARALMDAASRDDVVESARLEARFTRLWTLFRQHGSLRVAYAAVNLLGLSEAQPPRPLLALDAAQRERVRQALADLLD